MVTNREENIDEILAEIMCETMTDNRLQSWGIMVEKSDTQFIRECKVCEWLKAKCNRVKDKVSYTDVTNEVPRFTKIEVSNGSSDEWGECGWHKRVFIAKLSKGDEPYITEAANDSGKTAEWKFARIRKDWREHIDN